MGRRQRRLDTQRLQTRLQPLRIQPLRIQPLRLLQRAAMAAPVPQLVWSM